VVQVLLAHADAQVNWCRETQLRALRPHQSALCIYSDYWHQQRRSRFQIIRVGISECTDNKGHSVISPSPTKLSITGTIAAYHYHLKHSKDRTELTSAKRYQYPQHDWNMIRWPFCACETVNNTNTSFFKKKVRGRAMISSDLTFESPADHQPKDENQSCNASTNHQLEP